MREIGSDFWENEKKMVTDNFLEKEYSNFYINYFKSGRNAIKYLARFLKKKKNNVILAPMYTCSTVISSFIEEGWDIHYFDINLNLSPIEDDLEQKIEMINPSVILFHPYFGFDTFCNCYNLLKQAQKRGIVVIEDITQILFSTFAKYQADYYVSSLRKFFSISDGGIIISKKALNIQYCGAEIQLVELNKKACELKKRYIEYEFEKKERFLECFAKMKSIFDKNDEVKSITMEGLETFKTIDDEFIRSRRRKNYEYILGNMKFNKNIEPVCLTMTEQVVPLYFPIYCKDSDTRNKIQQFLARNSVYCPVIWPKPSAIEVGKSITKSIYNRILCIPCDQRYTQTDMEYIIKCFEKGDFDK